ncbi:MAG: hypothetical protein A3D65_02365 [Candidatus Lloydbacteria bacterium RIFCSPHIGHO2_02_FULL_50_13]|uniref:Uncharacterized protein n=1 Tax=Candidatus Lloydbacteria bacterium RIFCSPHIGHO2_02_FULL_50_13 TaxID=1798661 RepID=A0A1G2D009_9BACT|nr:MAG: hypothetical protein A3D65_02365 [Candidatus Lloydbacteria bacterium RIFCSPHIGHO2_02_FULL_50_13]
MAESTVVALRPYVVTVDVTTELYLITMDVTLCFGPFNTLEAANEWSLVLEREHKLIEVREAKEDTEAFGECGISTKPFFRAYVCGTDVIQVGADVRTKGGLILPSAAVIDAHQIRVYALRAHQEAITAAFRFLDDAKDNT